MNTYRTFSEEDQKKAIEWVKDALPDTATLAQLSFTGGRAFGWGEEPTDIDLRGHFVTEESDWFNKCHGNPDRFDITLKNIESFDDPDFNYYRWKQYYDNSNPIFIHNDFDYWDDFMDHCSVQKIHNVYPYDLKVQIGRMDSSFRARNCLHTYKELMIPLHFIYNDEIETDVTQINEHEQFGLEGLEQCVENYGPHGGGGPDELDEELIRQEIDDLFEELGDQLPEDERNRNINKMVTS